MAAHSGFGWMFSHTSTGSSQVKNFTQKKNNNNNKKNFKATVVNALLPARSIPSVNHTSCVESCFPINQSKKIKLIDSPNLEPRVILAPCQRYSHQIIGKYLIYLGIYVPNKYYVLYLAYVLYFTKEIKNMPNTLLSYLSTRELLRTREKCGEAWAEGGCFSHFSSLKNSRVLI